MLELIRTKAQGWVAWTIVILLVIPFALWGINEYISPNAEQYVAKVNDVQIPVRQYQQAFQLTRARLQQSLGAGFDPAMLESLGLKRRVLDNMIEEEVTVQAATKAGYRINDQQIAAEVRGLPDLQTDGNFDPARYERLLRSQGETPASFEGRVGRMMLLDQFMSGIADTTFVTGADLNRVVQLRDQQREVSYLTVPLSRFSGDVAVDEEAVNSYYASNHERYAVPEQARVDYVDLSVDDLMKSVQVDEDRVRESYETRRSEFAAEEQRRASHVLIEFGDDVEAARQKAEKLRQRAIAGESFEKLAEEYSEDKGSSGNGGDLGFFGAGIMDKAFEKATFALEKTGDISDVVKSAFGFHIIKLTGIQTGSGRSFDEVRDQIESDLRRRTAEELFSDRAEILANTAFEHPDTLSVAAQALALEVNTSNFFDHATGGGIASNATVREAAFSDEVYREGNNSVPIEIGPDHVVVIRVNERKASATRPLAEVRDEIINQLRNEQARGKIRTFGADLLAKLQDDSDHVAVAQAHKAVWNEAKFIKHNDPAMDAAIVTAAFSVGRPAANQALYRGIALANGDYAILRLTVVKDGDLAALDDAARTSLRETEARTRGTAEQRSVVSGLVKRADITRYESQI
ncbi:MAG: peptidyl-prolyl cis-trans isomerase D [Gammaproteobacteria bacterium]|nr:MAG: peptidyl-prolyl cis-trans isomerase D [Gammaproteobacteria bacterium]TND05003.1 MAG: peptidyl-prolyl cis-trans isomerase D [Gammaproteobacteria bacterium]